MGSERHRAGLGMREHKPVSGDRQFLLKGKRLVLKMMVSDTTAHGFSAEEGEAGAWCYR